MKSAEGTSYIIENKRCIVVGRTAVVLKVSLCTFTTYSTTSITLCQNSDIAKKIMCSKGYTLFCMASYTGIL